MTEGLAHLGSIRPTAMAAPLAMTRVPMKKVESRRRLGGNRTGSGGHFTIMIFDHMEDN